MKVMVTLTYELDGDIELAMEALVDDFSYHGGRPESIGGCHFEKGHFGAKCLDDKPHLIKIVEEV